jgi:RNA polymerase-binding transcription factor DksA
LSATRSPPGTPGQVHHAHAALADLRSAACSRRRYEHDPEGTTIAFERSQIGALVTQVRRHVAEVDAALARLHEGSYGVCEVCGGAIGSARLEALPAARACISCAAAGLT